MTHKEIFEALIAGKHIGHAHPGHYNVDIYLNEQGMLIGHPFDYHSGQLVVKAPWYERIPAGGVLCKVEHYNSLISEYKIITALSSSGYLEFVDQDGALWNSVTPMKKSEIQFLEDCQ